MCALTGVTAFASIKPKLLSERDLTRISDIFKLADMNGMRYQIKDYETNANPERFGSSDGKEAVFDWDRYFDGTRVVLDWED